MLMPSIFGENLFDDFFTFERPQKQYEKEVSCDLMKTDIREYEGGFELDINLPGCRKEDIQAELKDGTLTITAVSNKNTEEAAGRYIRRERFSGSCSRKFYVGEEITREDIRARFEDGVLKLLVPKKEAKKPEDLTRCRDDHERPAPRVSYGFGTAWRKKVKLSLRPAAFH